MQHEPNPSETAFSVTPSDANHRSAS